MSRGRDRLRGNDTTRASSFCAAITSRRTKELVGLCLFIARGISRAIPEEGHARAEFIRSATFLEFVRGLVKTDLAVLDHLVELEAVVELRSSSATTGVCLCRPDARAPIIMQPQRETQRSA